jgi:hypothetical protein
MPNRRWRIETQASRAEKDLAGQIGAIPSERRPRAHQIPNRVFDHCAVRHRGEFIEGWAKAAAS